MTFTKAITRKPGDDFAQGITTSKLGKPDYALMLEQHAAYVAALKSVGLEVQELEPLPGCPDAYFVEDVAVMVPEVVVITRPGAEARRKEADAIAPILIKGRQSARIQSPGTVDGGDVLLVGRHFFIGISSRTNIDGVGQLGKLMAKRGYTFIAVPVAAGLHLKSSVNFVGKDTLLITADYAKRPVFAKYNHILPEAGEEYAANTLFVNDHLIMPKGFTGTRQKLESLGYPIIEVDVSEARKMDGGLTCMSLRF